MVKVAKIVTRAESICYSLQLYWGYIGVILGYCKIKRKLLEYLCSQSVGKIAKSGIMNIIEAFPVLRLLSPLNSSE